NSQRKNTRFKSDGLSGCQDIDCSLTLIDTFFRSRKLYFILKIRQVTISELKSKFIKNLAGLYPSEEIQSFFYILSEKHLSFSRIETALHPQKEISAED